MRILDHRLVGATLSPRWLPDEWGPPLEQPPIIVVHYAVTLCAQKTADVLQARKQVSAHVAIDWQETVIQQAPFDRVAFHAGPSGYRGRPNVNKFSLGLEIANPGPLVKRGDRFFPTWKGAAEWTGGVVEAWHPNDKARSGWRYWAEYADTTVDLVCHLCELWRQEYGATDIVGHDQVSPGRKVDPGPAFPLRYVRRTVLRVEE